MRIGVFSDVHANYQALSAVIRELRLQKVEKLYCLGDTVGYGGEPEKCASVVRQVAQATILGNHDAAVAGRMDYSFYYDAARKALDTHAATLSRENIQWLKELPYNVRLPELGVELCHGSPVRLEEFEYIFAPEQARECLPIFPALAGLTLIGHSHLCKVFALRPGEVEELPAHDFTLQQDRKYIVSIGSVGQPRDFDNRASYAIYNTQSRHFQFHRVEYDIEAAAEEVTVSQLERNFANRLFIGV